MRPLIAFDLDGTLADSLEDIRRATERAFPERGPVPVSMTCSMVGHGARVLVQRHLEATGEAPSKSELDAGLVRFKEAYKPHLVDATRPYSGIVEMLDVLREAGAALAVATNKPGDWGREVVTEIFPGMFDSVVGPDDVGAHKPDPAMLAEVESKTGATLVAYVGDSVVDIEAATAHGVPCYAVTWGFGPEAELRSNAIGRDVVVVSDRPSLTSHLRALVT